MKFKKGDMAWLTYDEDRGNEDIGPMTKVMIHGRDRYTEQNDVPWAICRVGNERAYDVTVLDPKQGMSPSHWCWEHELRRVTTCPMTSR